MHLALAISSDANAQWTGRVQYIVTNGDSTKGYNPDCRASGLTVNRMTGDWSVTLIWYN